MTNEQIREVAIENGFKLKEQPDGEMDLNPYVYDFARALIDEREHLKMDWVVQPLSEVDND